MLRAVLNLNAKPIKVLFNVALDVIEMYIVHVPAIILLHNLRSSEGDNFFSSTIRAYSLSQCVK